MDCRIIFSKERCSLKHQQYYIFNSIVTFSLCLGEVNVWFHMEILKQISEVAVVNSYQGEKIIFQNCVKNNASELKHTVCTKVCIDL